jgi:serine protease
MKQLRLLLVLAVLVSVSACNTAAPSSKSTEITNSVSANPTPVFSATAVVIGKNAATVAGPDGKPVTFMLNQLVVGTNDNVALQAFLGRWQGRILKTIDPAKAKLPKLERMHLVQVNVSAASTANFEQDVKKLEPAARGPFKASSVAGSQLLAVAARETVNGLKVNPNWIMKPASFETEDAREAPSGPAGYSSNSFNWSYMKSGNIQDIGVTQAWQALERSGRLGNRVSVAVVDTGFLNNSDLPVGWQASSTDFSPALGTTGPVECWPACKWHGTAVAGTLAGVPNNNWGTAGTAGPVANLSMAYFDGSYFNLIDGLTQSAGLKIINVSYGIRMPLGLGWTVAHLDTTLVGLNALGGLVFAAAGNESEDVDATSCFLGICAESAYFVPCESPYVVCVGGLDRDSQFLALESNYGKEDVEIAAPFFVFAGPNSDFPLNQARWERGTSYSSPFAAGVAALIWAANPNLSASQVKQTLLTTAHYSQDSRVRKYVNAFEAVRTTIGNTSPGLLVRYPNPGELLSPRGTFLAAWVNDFEDATCCTVTWTSSVDGALGMTTGSSSEIQYRFTTLGPRTIRVVARDSAGVSSIAQNIPVNVVNTAPIVSIARPVANETIYRGSSILLRSSSYDPDEPNTRLACTGLRWTSSLATDPLPVTGCDPSVVFPTAGIRTLTLTGTDAFGATGSASVTINVLVPGQNLPPNVKIFSPGNETPVGPGSEIMLIGTASDPENQSPLSMVWDVAYPYDTVTGTAPNSKVITPGVNGIWRFSDSIPMACESSFAVRLRLRATDPGGAAGSDFVILRAAYVC